MELDFYWGYYQLYIIRNIYDHLYDLVMFLGLHVFSYGLHKWLYIYIIDNRDYEVRGYAGSA